MLKASIQKYQLNFKRPAGTSRGVYQTRDIWILKVWNPKQPLVMGYGECAPLPNLSCDNVDSYESVIELVATNINNYQQLLDNELIDYPSIRFGLETAIADLSNGGCRLIFDTSFFEGTYPITINGLIWMGDIGYMKEQIEEKLKLGFRCLKMKIGALVWNEEYEVLKQIRESFSASQLELRVDANGGFTFEEAPAVLDQLARLGIHSIEQPIRQQQLKQMAQLCSESPIDIALDEELIGVNKLSEKAALLDDIKPQYIILKPSLHGGIIGCNEWIALADERNIGWWITSALESNIGLNAIAQYASTFTENKLPQGLGTGQLFTNNFNSPLALKGDQLYYSNQQNWNIDEVLSD